MKIGLRTKKVLWCLPVALLIMVSMALAFQLAASPQSAKAASVPDDPLVGYGAGTTGGAGGSSVTVSSLAALESAVSGSSAKIVNISGTITGDVNVMVGSNTTIMGVGSTAALVGISLDLDGVSNVIIRNLSISYVLAASTTGDGIHIIDGTNHVWVDHNTLFSDLNHGKDYYDGLLDITRASDYITVSWNRFHDHYKVSLVGHSDSNGSQDIGHLHVTYHHNWFYNVNSRLPSLRFGTGHVYNNYFQNVTDSAVHSRMGAQMLIENNVFRSVGTAITTTGDSKQDGYANASGNDYGGATVDITQVGTFTQAPYSYTLDPTTSVIDEVSTYSGVGIISGSGNPTPNPTPTQGTTPTATPTQGTTPTATPTSTPVSGSIYQAENATLSNATVATTNSGYTGSGYVVYGGSGGYIQWTVSVPSSAKFSLVFRYANTASNSLPASVSVNGTVIKADLTFKSTGSGSTWSTTQTSGTLPAGTVTIRLTAGSSGGSNIDYLQLVSA
jgi:pectate lyase